MSTTYTGNEASFSLGSSYQITQPIDGEDVTAASEGAEHQKHADALQWLRKAMRGEITVKRLVADGTGSATGFTEAGSGTGYLAASFGGSGLAPMLDLHDTTSGAAQVRFYRSNAGLCAWVANAYYDIGAAKWTQEDTAKDSYAFSISPGDAPPVQVAYKAAGSAAWTTWDAGTISIGKSSHTTARSSTTAGSGQSVAAGDIYKDTAPLAWGVVRVDTTAGNAITLRRAVNVASVVRNGVGDYTVTLQSGAANILCPVITPIDSGLIIAVLDSAHLPTTTAFRFLMYAGGVLSDTTGAPGGFSFQVFGG